MTFISLSIMLTLKYHPIRLSDALDLRAAQFLPDLSRVNRNVQHLAGITPSQYTHANCIHSVIQ